MKFCNSIGSHLSMYKRLALFLLFYGGIIVPSYSQYHIYSPQRNTVLTIDTVDGRLYYRISYRGVSFLENSPLGFCTDMGDFISHLSFDSTQVCHTDIDETYVLPTIKKSFVHYRAHEAILPIVKEGKVVYDIIFRVGENDIAFRYRLYPQNERLCCVVKEEATGFVFPEGTTSFLCPQSKAMTGFARTMPSYEMQYLLDDSLEQNGIGEGYTFPCLFRNGKNGWLLISETGVDGSYCGSRLIGHSGRKYTIGYPMCEEANGNGTPNPGVALPVETPWRTITLGGTLAPIVETTIPFDLVTPLYEASMPYRYGRGSWSWIIKSDPSTNYDEQRRYIDFSAAMRYESVLVDALWDTQIGRERVEELARYAQEKGVRLFLWYNSNGYWNDAPQTPRQIMSRSISRRKEMKWLQKIGIAGIKVDFLGGDKQMMMQLYEDILADANDYGLMVIFHGCTLPRGWERMYPNYVASEAVLASENMHFSQYFCDKEATFACIHPFIRNAVASMDFGGSTLNHYYRADNVSGSKRQTSDVFALATAVLFQSPVQHFALAPNNLYGAPAWAIEFMQKVPSTWDDVRFIDGYPGRFVVLARRHGDMWYIVGVNAQKESRKITLDLSMIDRKQPITIYSDDENLQGNVATRYVGRKNKIDVRIPCNGAFVIVGNSL